LKKLGTEEMFLNIIKAVANIILNGEKLNPFLLQSGKEKDAYFLQSYST
jgi:hypothetical protein